MFFLTMLSPNHEDVQPRCVGFFIHEYDAMRILGKDYGDLTEEGYYTHAVIEEGSCGLYPVLHQISWWIYRGGEWERCEHPSKYRQTCNFAMG